MDPWNDIILSDFVENLNSYNDLDKNLATKIALNDYKYLINNYHLISDIKRHDYLFIAFRFNTEFNLIKFIIDKFNVDFQTKTKRNRNFLNYACMYVTEIHIIKYLIDHIDLQGIDVQNMLNSRDYWGDNCLTLACWKNPNLNIIKYLINNLQMDKHSTDKNGRNLLLIACWSNSSIDVIKYLINELKFEVTRYEFFLACQENPNINVIKFLFEETNISTDSCCKYALAHVLKRENKIQLVKILVYLFENIDMYIDNVTINPNICVCVLDQLKNKNKLKHIFEYSIKKHSCRLIIEECEKIKINYSKYCILINFLNKNDVISQVIPESIDSWTEHLETVIEIVDYTEQPEFLFKHNSFKFFGNRNIIFNSILFLKTMKDHLIFDDNFELEGHCPKYVINIYIHTIMTHILDINRIKPCDIIEFIKFMDQYPIDVISIDSLDHQLLIYFNKHKNVIIYDPFIESLCQRYQLKYLYLYVHDQL